MSKNIGFKVSTAIAWRIMTELCRRHHATQKLQIYETHPCSGQYDCLSLYASVGDKYRHLCDFNRQSDHLHIWYPNHELTHELHWPDHNNYVQAVLQANDHKDVVNQIESILLLPNTHNHKSSTPPVLMMRIVAEVLEQTALSRKNIDIRWAIHDSSGMEGTSVKSGLFDIDEYKREAELIGQDKVANRCWFLHYQETNAVIDFRGILRLQSNNYEPWYILNDYNAGQKACDLADKLMQMLE
jgi:hypothetical protein